MPLGAKGLHGHPPGPLQFMLLHVFDYCFYSVSTTSISTLSSFKKHSNDKSLPYPTTKYFLHFTDEKSGLERVLRLTQLANQSSRSTKSGPQSLFSAPHPGPSKLACLSTFLTKHFHIHYFVMF